MNLHLTQTLHRALRYHPDRAATVFGERRRSYRELVDRVARLAAAFHQLGATAGDRIGILALNSDRYVETYLATFWAGCVTSAVNTRWTNAEILRQLKDSRPFLMLVDETFVASAQLLAREYPGLHHLIYMGEGEAPEGMHHYETLIAANEPVADALRSGDDLAMIVYTGGTTGFPKGAMVSHANMVSASVGMSAMGCGTGESLLLAVPMFHMAGVQMMFNNFIGGGTHVVIPGFNPTVTLAALQTSRPRSLMLVPTMLQMLLAAPDFADYDISSLGRIFYGAAPITESLLQQALTMLPGVEFIQGYGMSESGITLMLPPKYHTNEGRVLGKLRAAGQVAPLAEVRIAGVAGGDAPSNTPGEILVRGPMVMQGYWEQPVLTEQAIRDGWLHTGDVGYMDEDGFIFIVDRLKDMIITGGENVFSSEVENAIASHPDVQSCAVVGLPDEKWGEIVHAAVVTKSGANIDADDLVAHCRSLISNYKVPKSISFRKNLPMSAAGKLLKYALRSELQSGNSN